MNATIPYKRTVMPYLDELSDIAQRLGNVNTITRLPDGRLRGDNTDYYGFQVLVESVGVDLRGKHALVFGGDGGAGSTCMTVLGDLGAIPHAVGRSGDITYDDLDAWSHAALAVNCTPVGMYPDCPASVCGLESLTDLEAFVDIVYNPARTSMMMDAEERGIPTAGGLLMLVAQAAQAVERYVGETVSMDRIMQVTDELSRSVENIALIGMPGCGKTRVGERLAELGGREHIDIDREFDRRHGMPAPGFILSNGEDAFRGGRVGDHRRRRQAKRPGHLLRGRRGREAGELPAASPEQPYRHARSAPRRALDKKPTDHRPERDRAPRRDKAAEISSLGRRDHNVARIPLATATEVARSLHLPSAHGTTRD